MREVQTTERKNWPEVTRGFYSCENKKEKKKDSGNSRTMALWPHQHAHMAGQLIIERALHSCVIKYPAQLVQRQVGINQGQLINFFFFPLICLFATEEILARKLVRVRFL